MELIEELKQAEKDIKNGDVISHEDYMKELRKEHGDF